MGSKLVNLSKKDVRQRIISAIVKLYRHDRELLEYDVNERSVTHKFAEYLKDEFPTWDVDCEYNRTGHDIKRLIISPLGKLANTYDLEAQKVIPDIIVHRRGTMKNLIVIEIKKEKGVSDEPDRKKVRAFVSRREFRYGFGILARLSLDGKSTLERYDPKSRRWEEWSDQLRSILLEL